MNKDILTIEFDIEPSPFRSKLIKISFSKLKLQPIIDELVDACSGRDYKASYHYDKHVNQVINKFWDKASGSLRPLMKAIYIMIKQQQPSDAGKDWHNGYVAAARVINSQIAYMTPGFIEAKRYNEAYGV
tara:strand:- start:448 stop:837 length:390 start_codon:yes stop_codon:yes gene_type:complete